MPRTLVYIACQADGTVDTLALDPESGALTPVARTEDLPRVSALALDPAGTLYAGINAEPRRTVALALDPATGVAMPGPAEEVPASTCYLGLGPDGGTLFSASYHEGLMVSYPVPKASIGRHFTEYRSGPNTHCALPSPDGRFVYTASLGEDRISWFALGGEAGALAHDGVAHPAGSVASAPGSGPRHLRLSPDGTRVYALHELSGEVAVYARDAATGALEELQRVSSVEGLGLDPGSVRSASNPDPGPSVAWCADVRLTPDGRFLYATERSTSTLASFAVGEDGRLAYLGRTETEAQPRGIAVDPSGRWLLACGERSHHVTSYAIGPDGALEPVSRAETARGPLWIECWRPHAV